MLSDTYRPKNQAECDHANALREYEAAHKVWMNTSTFTEAGKLAKAVKDEAKARYEKAYLAANPTHRLESRRKPVIPATGK